MLKKYFCAEGASIVAAVAAFIEAPVGAFIV